MKVLSKQEMKQVGGGLFLLSWLFGWGRRSNSYGHGHQPKC